MKRQKSKRRQDKEKARERHNRKNRRALSETRRTRDLERQIRQTSPLPEFKLDTSESTDDIRDLVLAGIEKFDSTYVRQMDEDAVLLLGAQHRAGWTDAVNSVAAEIQSMTRSQVERGFTQLVETELGNGILRCAPPHLVRRALPTSCFTLKPGERHWNIRCRTLRPLKTAHGLLYQSPHQPTVRFSGIKRQVAFTKHALLQLADRIIPAWKDYYIGQVYVFGFLYECVHFGKAELANGQEAFVVYNSCLRAGQHLRTYMRKLVKVKEDRDLRDYYYIVGYCPVTLDGGLAVAKTFLTPGYWQTPERKTLKVSGRVDLLRDIEQACDEGINVVSVATCKKTQAAIKWFHTNGVPQVRKITKAVFKDMGGPYDWIMRVLEEEDEPEARSTPAAS